MALRLTLRGDVWQVTGTVTLPTGERRRVRRSTGYTRHQRQYASAVMSQIINEAMQEKAQPEAVGTTFEQVVDVYLQRPERVGKTDQVVLNRAARHFQGRPLSSLNAGELMVYVTGRGNAPSTVAREINSINAALRYAKDVGFDVPEGLTLKRPQVDDARTRWLTASERDRLIAACDPTIQRLVTFLFFTGARLGEAFDLTWEMVAEDTVYLTTRKGRSKARRTRGIPLTSKAMDAVGIRPEGAADDDFVFPAPRGGRWLRQHFYPHWRRACETAGVRDFRPHDCRHTFASLLIQSGVGLREVADLLGHSQLTMVMRYSHLGPSHLKVAIGHLESAL